MDEVWQIELFGWLRAVFNERVVSRFRSQQTAELLAYLAYYRHRSHPREVLVELLWPGCDPEAGRHRLRTALSSLRRQLEPPGTPPGAVLLADRLSIQLNPLLCETDVSRFEAALQAATRADNAASCVQRLAEAVELYRGELLPGYFGGWIVPERQRWGEAALRALAQLITRLEQARDFQQALQYALRAVGLDPLREESHQDLMRLWRTMGQPEAALRQYQALERLLQRELGARPTAEIRAMARALESMQPSSADRESAEPPEAPSPAEAIFHASDARAEPTLLPTSGMIAFLLTQTIVEGNVPREASARAALIAALRPVLRSTAEEKGGYVIEDSDGIVQLTFGRVSDAVVAAIAVQQAIISYGEATAPPALRMALHLGEVGPVESIHSSEALRHATRLLLAAHGGQILTSEETASILRRDPPAEIRLVDLGLFHLSDRAEPERLYQVDPARVPRQHFPPPLIRRAHVGRLPPSFDRFFGRETEIEELSGLLSLERTAESISGSPKPGTASLVTLTGSGGSGKTRLALETGRRLQPLFEGAVWFVPLQDVKAPEQIVAQIHSALCLPRSPLAEPLDQVVEALSHRPALLVLDNLEHLAEEGAAWIRRLLEQIDTLTVLATSRRRLELPAEREFSVMPLPVPKSPEHGAAHGHSVPARPTVPAPYTLPLSNPSVALFIDRAQAVRPDFQLTPANATAIAELCRRLEGLPLAIELAAARAGVATPTQMLSRLEHRFELLVRRNRSTDSRHRSLRAALDWSYELLTPGLQRFFARLSVFHGGWLIDAAEQICSEAGLEPEGPSGAEWDERYRSSTPWPASSLACLEELQRSSLVLVENADADLRFRLLETVREYAAERLTPREKPEVARRHAEYYLGMAEETHAHMMCGPGQRERLDRLEAENDNLRAVLGWAKANGETEVGLRMAAALGFFWDIRGYLTEGQAHLASLLARPEAAAPILARVRALNVSGSLAVRCGDHASARARHEEALAICRTLGDRQGLAETLRHLGVMAQVADDFAGATEYAEAALALFEALGDSPGIANCLNQLGLTYICRGDFDRARLVLERALAIGHENPASLVTAVSMNNLGLAVLRQGQVEEAETLFVQSVRIKAELGSTVTIPWGLEGLAAVAAAKEQMMRSTRLFAAAESLRRSVGHPLTAPARRAIDSRWQTAARRALAASEFGAAWAAGEALSLDEAVRLACAEGTTATSDQRSLSLQAPAPLPA